MPTKVTDLTAKTLNFVDDDVFMVDKYDSDLEVYTSEKYTWYQLKQGLKVYIAERDFNATEINSMDTISFEIISALGANTIILVDTIHTAFKAGATPYTTTGEIKAYYDIGGTLISSILTSSELTVTSNKVTQKVISNNLWGAAEINKPVVVNCDAAISGGDGKIKMIVKYSVIDFSTL